MTGSAVLVEPFQETASGEAPVRGYLHRPLAAVGDGIVLTHGAGANAEAPLLRALAQAFAMRGLVVLRCDLPFRQARAKGPPSPGSAPEDRDGLRRAVLALRKVVTGRVFLGGQSYGGRQASMVAAHEAGLVDGLLLLSYPLHPPGRPEAPRTGHFAALRTPALFVHGTADPFGSVDEVETARHTVPATTALVVIPGGRHDLYPGVRSTTASAELAERMASAFLALVGAADAGQR